MGYYTGSGVVTGGSDTISNIGTALVGATLNFFRREVKSTAAKSGVSLATAQAATSTSSITPGDCTWSSYRYPFPVRNGTVKSISYARISDSNLYALTEETTTFSTRINDGNWNS